MYDYIERLGAKIGEGPATAVLIGIPAIPIFIVAFVITGDAVLSGIVGFVGGLLGLVGLMAGAEGSAAASQGQDTAGPTAVAPAPNTVAESAAPNVLGDSATASGDGRLQSEADWNR